MTAMTASRLTSASVVLVAGLLAGCATPPAPDPTAEIPYCHKTNKGRVITCTAAPVPSLNADAQAKQFAPDPNALTVYAVSYTHLDVYKRQGEEGQARRRRNQQPCGPALLQPQVGQIAANDLGQGRGEEKG